MDDKEKRDKPLYCMNCFAEFFTEQFGEEFEQVIDYYSVQERKKELELLLKAQDMYRKYPESKNKMIPLWEIQEQSKPTDEEIDCWTKGDKALSDYLLSRSFNMDARKRVVEKSLKQNASIEPLMCPVCSSGIVSFKEGRYKEFEPRLSR